MDPDQALTELRSTIQAFHLANGLGDVRGAVSVAADVMEKFENLDSWLRRGGHPPSEWQEGDEPDPSVQD